MAYNVKSTNEPTYKIRFRGGAMIPRIAQMAPCRLDLTYKVIESILESLYRRPLLLEVYYVDVNGKEWPINYGNYKKVLPKLPETPKVPGKLVEKTPEVKKEDPMPKPIEPVAQEEPVEIIKEEELAEQIESVANMEDRMEEMETIVDDEEKSQPAPKPEYNNQYRNNNQYNKNNKHRH